MRRLKFVRISYENSRPWRKAPPAAKRRFSLLYHNEFKYERDEITTVSHLELRIQTATVKCLGKNISPCVVVEGD